MVYPFVAVFMVTFNHEKYVGQAIDSVLMQKTRFPVKLFIGEDCSTDQTASICLKYQEENPDIIEVVINKENTGALKNAKQIYEACFASGAKYIAMLEGDDYWTDPFKLQKQVDFLELNSDYVVSCHDAAVIGSNGELITKSKLPGFCKQDFSGKELIKGALILTLSICFRNVIKEIPAEYGKVFNGDTFLTSMLGVFGRSKYQDEIEPAVYRLHTGGIWSSKSDSERKEEQQRTYYYLFRFHRRIKSDKNVVKILFEKYYNLKYDSFFQLIKDKKTFNSVTIFPSLLFDCIKYGYLGYLIKSFKKSYRAFSASL